MSNFNDLSDAEKAAAVKAYEQKKAQHLKDMRYLKKVQMQIAFAKSKNYNPTDAEVDIELRKAGKIS